MYLHRWAAKIGGRKRSIRPFTLPIRCTFNASSSWRAILNRCEAQNTRSVSIFCVSRVLYCNYLLRKRLHLKTIFWTDYVRIDKQARFPEEKSQLVEFCIWCHFLKRSQKNSKKWVLPFVQPSKASANEFCKSSLLLFFNLSRYQFHILDQSSLPMWG